MGCVADKPIHDTKYLAPTQRFGPNTHSITSLSLAPQDQSSLLSSRIAEAIKKRDIILFQKAIQQYQVKPNDVVGPTSQLKTVLHKLAEHNFHDGMSLLLQELSSQKYPQLSRVLNMRDVDGNTPLLLCCLSNAVETLEVLVKNEFVDIEAKNFAKKTALEIALEMESPCSNVLNSIISSNNVTTKATIKSHNEASQQLRSLEEESAKVPHERENLVCSINNFDTRTSLETKTYTNIGEDSNTLKNLYKDSYSSDKLLYHILVDLKIKDTNFRDVEFPHETYFLEGEETEGDLLRKFPAFSWTRPSEFMTSLHYMNKQPTVFEDFFCNSTAKTPLAGCEIYSAFAALAEFPQRLVQIFNTKEFNRYGVYSINFNVAGSNVEVLLDDYFPTTDGTRLFYSQPTNGELWFSLLEKAFAKLHGGYVGLESIGIMEALETLTGMPVAQKSLKDVEEDKLWAKLVDYDKKNYIMCAGEIKRYHTGSRNRNFSVIGVLEIDDLKLIKIRNHYGEFIWEGDFSRASNLWTQELKEKVGFHESDNTCFYMQLKDFIREFDFLTVCHYHDNWTRNTIEASSQPNHPSYFEINIEKETETYICVHQRAPKFVEEGPHYDISPVEIILARDLDGTGLETIAVGEREAFLGKSTVYLHDMHRVKLQPGRYVLYLKIRWIDGNSHGFVLNMLSSVAPKVSQIEAQVFPNFLERIYVNAGMGARDKFFIGNDCYFSSGWSGSHLWVSGHNKGKKTWTLEIVFQKMRNLKLGKQGRAGQNVLRLIVPPGQRVAGYAKRTGPGVVGVSWELGHSWK